ncbi:hypothetical protein TTHERM_000019719 (macronuclear) [Tetrahymena thermophila SB210]|uniref:Uncharacterized protein n=1 Tax=Tetrahymena thermophila (strain SB210) TaxID=312017 RepID=W7XKC0_TETTS|nr:hypothetical protein TTHERM_000019719 [Tetrahymena thermophila SB210]EWS76386.1 hypothetical protein TTHERM_000019719 [Tetrahymena thermophila SB210]|eukprot:XP_012651170.1 hypothetical protein TTHERM_000019719 [Tetrahymena thermophila SB210]
MKYKNLLTQQILFQLNYIQIILYFYNQMIRILTYISDKCIHIKENPDFQQKEGKKKYALSKKKLKNREKFKKNILKKKIARNQEQKIIFIKFNNNNYYIQFFKNTDQLSLIITTFLNKFFNKKYQDYLNNVTLTKQFFCISYQKQIYKLIFHSYNNLLIFFIHFC